ncbi:MAG: nuclear transport factor 2 family protein [Lapillicoccus sp.]
MGQDVDATMATMTDDPVVVPVATAVGARGRQAVRDFYATWFIGHQASDMKLSLSSRTVTAERVVDEMTISFTHDTVIPWILPSVAPTGPRVVVPIVTVIGMREGLVASEHIYWDQATVLAQVGLIDPEGLPVTGPEQLDTLGQEPDASAFNALLGSPESGSPPATTVP